MSDWDRYYIRRLREVNRKKDAIPAPVRALLAFSDLDDDQLEEAVDLLGGEDQK